MDRLNLYLLSFVLSPDVLFQREYKSLCNTPKRLELKDGGRGRVRTYDPLDVTEVLSH